MKSQRPLRIALAAALSAGLPFGLLADVKLPSIISDNMVLQAGAKDRIWGKADPGENVEVSFAGQSKKTVADADGRWSVELDPMKANGESASLTVSGKNKIEVKNVVVGEVWLGSGQSNMEWRVTNVMNAKDEMEKADFPLIRSFTVAKGISPSPMEECSGKWEVCTPKTVGGFSAVMYFFGRDLHNTLKAPVGLLHSSWGGSSIQAWIPKEILEANPTFAKKVEFPEENYANMKVYNEYRKGVVDKAANKDEGNKGEGEGWAKPDFDAAGWKESTLPQPMEKFFGMDFDGAVWFRKSLDVPASWAGKDLSAKLGSTQSAMTVYFNGEKVFSCAYTLDNNYPGFKIPGKLVKEGANVLAVRYFNHMGNGGLTGGAPGQLNVSGPDGKEIFLAGKWLGKVETKLDPSKGPSFLPSPKDIPFALYNAMIAPIQPYTLRGSLWYQGESNAGDPKYGKMMEEMIKSWRGKLQNPEMPFYYVQLANYMEKHKDPVDTSWAKLRESQRETLAVPNTAMAVIIDIGNPKDVHPTNKQDVGKRLALPARHFVYGDKDLEYTGPVFESLEAKDGALVMKFSHARGMTAKDGELKGFAISEDGSKFVWANARIDGDKVILENAALKNPKHVRYAWDDDPDCTLYNGDGIPASPFKASLK